HRDVLAPVVDGDGVANHLRDDRRATAPRADDPLLVLLVQSLDLLHQMVVDEGALLQTACHFRSPPTLLRPATHDVLVGWMLLLAGARLGLAPWADRIPAARGLAFTAAQGMVDGVHRHAAGLGTHALPAGAA